MASVNANPIMVYRNIFASNDGFRDIPIMNAPNTVPIPTPAPAKPTVAAPAPINFAACRIIFSFLFSFSSFDLKRFLCFPPLREHGFFFTYLAYPFTIHRDSFFLLRVGFPFALRPHGVTSGRPPRVRPPCG